MHPLDNVIWQALTTRQTEFAESFGEARRFIPEVTSLAACLRPDDAGYESLAGLVGAGGTAAIFLDLPYQPRRGWKVVGNAPALQMVQQDGSRTELAKADSALPIVELGAADSGEMMELTTLTKPGPFGPRTHELGNYLGIRSGGKLVAMAGERMRVPGYTEVSAVCTHPEHTGHGYAAALMRQVMLGILDRGEVPFLHLRQDNVRAIELYYRLGFRERFFGHYVILRRE
jgi:ribosomal protein S18 acetylase RimI-like enzyme